MALTNFRASSKTCPPWCSFDCCGCRFGRIERRSMYVRVHSGINRIIRARRYAKHVERQKIQQEIREALIDYYRLDSLDLDYFSDSLY